MGARGRRRTLITGYAWHLAKNLWWRGAVSREAAVNLTLTLSLERRGDQMVAEASASEWWRWGAMTLDGRDAHRTIRLDRGALG